MEVGTGGGESNLSMLNMISQKLQDFSVAEVKVIGLLLIVIRMIVPHK